MGGPPGQPAYLNGALTARTTLAAEELLAFLQELERAAGRVRDGIADAPRPLDLDLLLHGDELRDAPELVLPHPRMLARDFVLVPLARIAPGWRHPRTGRTIAEALHALALHELEGELDHAAAR